MLEAALEALQTLLVPARLGFLAAGVLIGLALGAIPGLGGIVGLAILLPFTFDMDPFAAFAIMIGLHSVVNTADTLPAVLFGIPGSAAAQATILDGHAMAKKGEAGRALGAAYMSSMMGGLFGALVLGLSVPMFRPMVLAFGAPEFFMLGMFGVSMVAVLGGRSPLKGIIAGMLGLLAGGLGSDPQTAILRWTFRHPYLEDGLPLVPLSLGIFAIPEVADLVIKGTRIADVPKQSMKGVSVGVRDAFRHWFLVLRCSAIGTWVGFIPGVGAGVIDWFAYGHAAQTEKDARLTFGKGDVRGVIAPESANNSKEGGVLIPTIAFGVPGGAAMALLLGAFTIHGLVPGPDMLTTNLNVTYAIVWSIALANILGTTICLLSSNLLAKMATIRLKLMAPLLVVIVVLASFQASRYFGDLVVLVFFSFLGWFMKRFGWPRPPLLLAFVLSPIVEQNLFISVARYGYAWLSRPFVIVIGILIILSMSYGFLMRDKESGSD